VTLTCSDGAIEVGVDPDMDWFTYIPARPLSDFVELFWFYQSYAPPHGMERVLPTGTMELVTVLGNADAPGGGPIVSGAHSQSFTLDTSRPMSVVGVHFRPGGAFPFLGVPAGELHNAQVSLDALWGAKAGELRERLLEAKSAAAKFRILEQTLLSRAKAPLLRHPAVDFAIKEFVRVPHARTIADVTAQSALSPRRFIRIFADQVGLTPKLFCRVRRFQEVLRTIQSRQEVDWADVAVACGYYDQPHFIADFKAFSGLNPTAYLRIRGEHLNHVPLVDSG
jgi:AraC-like DNA-binding protein